MSSGDGTRDKPQQSCEEAWLVTKFTKEMKERNKVTAFTRNVTRETVVKVQANQENGLHSSCGKEGNNKAGS